MNEFVSWCRHLLVSFLFHALTSLHPLHFIEMIFPLVKQEVSPVLDVVIEEEGERGGWDIR